MKINYLLLLTALASAITACKDPELKAIDDYCESNQVVDTTRGACTEELFITSEFTQGVNSAEIIISCNNIPEHRVGLFGEGEGSLNPNAIRSQNSDYRINRYPEEFSEFTPLLGTTGFGAELGPQYSFGILFNGVELDPVAAEPFPHKGVFHDLANWEWNLEALNVNLGLDCNNAHVQPNGKYHYHGVPKGYLESLNISADKMTQIGFAADGFPIYYKYAYEDAMDTDSPIIEMIPSYELRFGERPGDGIYAPCGEFNGAYTGDYLFIEDLGTLDLANGRFGKTPEYPNGIYYYVITDAFPSIPRFFRGLPSDDFKIGA